MHEIARRYDEVPDVDEPDYYDEFGVSLDGYDPLYDGRLRNSGTTTEDKRFDMLYPDVAKRIAEMTAINSPDDPENKSYPIRNP